MKKNVRRVIYISPIFFLIIWIIADFMVFHNIYGSDVSLTKLLFTEPQKIFVILDNPDVVLSEVDDSVIVFIQIFIIIWLGLIFLSLFFVCKQLNTKSETHAINAILIEKEPYLIVQEVISELKQIKNYKNNIKMNSLIYNLKCLEEKFSVESEFGYGNNIVIDCENIISKHLQTLLNVAKNIEDGNFNENIKLLNITISKINLLLQKRANLKRK